MRSSGLVCQAIETLQTPTRIPECGGLQGMDRAVTTCHLPLNCGAPSYSLVSVHSSTMPVYKETTHVTLGLQPYGLTSKNIGKPEGTTNHHRNPSSTSTHTSHMNVEER
jgi:hypothetical protein